MAMRTSPRRSLDAVLSQTHEHVLADEPLVAQIRDGEAKVHTDTCRLLAVLWHKI
jgi:hypothetical protein